MTAPRTTNGPVSEFSGCFAPRVFGPISLRIEYNRGGAISRSATTNFCKRRIATCNSLSVCFGAESLLPQRHHRLDLHWVAREIAGSGGNRGQHRGNGNERQRIGGAIQTADLRRPGLATMRPRAREPSQSSSASGPHRSPCRRFRRLVRLRPCGYRSRVRALRRSTGSGRNPNGGHQQCKYGEPNQEQGLEAPLCQKAGKSIFKGGNAIERYMLSHSTYGRLIVPAMFSR